MNIPIITERYAKALYSLAAEMDVQQSVAKDMRILKQVTETVPEFRLAMKSPVIQPHVKARVIKEVFQNSFHQLSVSFLELIIRKGRSTIIDNVADQYIQMLDQDEGRLKVEITSAMPLDAGSLSLIRSKIATYTGKEISSVEKLNPNLIGGFSLRFGDIVSDQSIRKKLNLVAKEFDKNSYKKGF